MIVTNEATRNDHANPRAEKQRRRNPQTMQTLTPEEREVRHQEAREAWSACGRRSPVDGLGERLRAKPRGARPDARALERSKHLKELDAVRAANTRYVMFGTRPNNEAPRYMPHQSEREKARRRGDLKRAPAGA